MPVYSFSFAHYSSKVLGVSVLLPLSTLQYNVFLFIFICRLLGKIDQAYKDLGKGQGIDYDDDTDELQKSLKDDVSTEPVYP